MLSFSCADGSQDGAIVCNPDPSIGFRFYEVQVTAVDLAGNSAMDTCYVIVEPSGGRRLVEDFDNDNHEDGISQLTSGPSHYNKNRVKQPSFQKSRQNKENLSVRGMRKLSQKMGKGSKGEGSVPIYRLVQRASTLSNQRYQVASVSSIVSKTNRAVPKMSTTRTRVRSEKNVGI